MLCINEYVVVKPSTLLEVSVGSIVYTVGTSDELEQEITAPCASVADPEQRITVKFPRENLTPLAKYLARLAQRDVKAFEKFALDQRFSLPDDHKLTGADIKGLIRNIVERRVRDPLEIEAMGLNIKRIDEQLIVNIENKIRELCEEIPEQRSPFSVQIFGSCASLLAEESSDIDFVVGLYVDNRPFDAFKRMVENVVTCDEGLHDGDINVLEMRTGAKVPIIRLEVFNKIVEISFIKDGSTVAIRNSALMRDYARAAPHLFLALAVFRRWAKERDISAQKGSLNTYGFGLLLVYVLIIKWEFPRPSDIEKFLPREISLGIFLRSVFAYYGKEHKWTRTCNGTEVINTIYITAPMLRFTVFVECEDSNINIDGRFAMEAALAKLLNIEDKHAMDVYVSDPEAVVKIRAECIDEMRSMIEAADFCSQLLKELRERAPYKKAERVVLNIPSAFRDSQLIDEPCGGPPIRVSSLEVASDLQRKFQETQASLEGPFHEVKLLGRVEPSNGSL